MKLPRKNFLHKAPLPLRHIGRKGAWMLMEVIIALTIFSTGVVSFIVALNQTAKVSMVAQNKSLLFRLLEGALMEASTIPDIYEHNYTLTPEEMDISISVDISPIELFTKDDILMNDMWLIRVTGEWTEDDEMKTESLETYRYGRMYLP